MKIAILTEILSTHSGSRAPIELAKSLSLHNKITLLAYSFLAEKGVQNELEKRGVKVVLVNPPKIPFGKWWAAFKFFPHLKKSEIISFHGTLPTFLVAKLSGRPLIKTYYGTQLDAYYEKLLPEVKPSLKDKYLNWLGNQVILCIQRIYFGLSTQVVAISTYTSQEAKKLYGKKISFFHLGATKVPTPDEEHLRGEEHREHLRGGGIDPALAGSRDTSEVKKERPTILSVSRLTPYKGFHHLIKAVRETGNGVNLFIVGPVSQPKYLEYLKKIKTPQTKILIDLSDQKLANLYQNSDIYASCDRYLFFGLPILEAALFEKPSVILNTCAAQEIVIHEKTGFVAKDLNEFTKYLKVLIDNPALGAKMGQEAKIWAQKKFSWQKTAQKYHRLFQNLL